MAALVRSHSVVTLTGVGGVGKTRLALAVGTDLAEEFPDGVWLVELASVADAETVPDVIASALGITPQGGLRVIDAVAEALAGRRVLIVLDNCEHVLAGAADAVGRDPRPLGRPSNPGNLAGGSRRRRPRRSRRCRLWPPTVCRPTP